MSSYTKHTVIVLPADMREAGNQVGDQMGWGPENYTVPLCGDNDPGTITHYGLAALMTDVAVQILTDAQSGTYPEGMEGAAPVVEAMHMSVQPADNLVGHFDAVLGGLGLVRYLEGDPV